MNLLLFSVKKKLGKIERYLYITTPRFFVRFKTIFFLLTFSILFYYDKTSYHILLFIEQQSHYLQMD